ncbi:TPA: phage tail protein [Salmonella enterica subsp. enterica serovar Concord]|nr:phage tail protein [Salmonella enterica subsp. enterica serovar Concord]
MAVRGLEQAVKNLNSINSWMVPQACVWAVNKVAQKAITQAVRKVAKNTIAGDNRKQGIPVKLVRQRVKLWKASAKFSVDKQRARIRINRGNLPAIKLGTAQIRLTRKKGKLLRGGSVLKIGPYLFRDAFIQQLPNGRWHVMRRTDGKNRYPIDVVKIPLAAQLTQAFEEEKQRILAEEMPKELAAALKQQFRLYLTRL